jgi:hypothetical protein
VKRPDNGYASSANRSRETTVSPGQRRSNSSACRKNAARACLVRCQRVASDRCVVGERVSGEIRPLVMEPPVHHGRDGRA